jgi:hypothetical protein
LPLPRSANIKKKLLQNISNAKQKKMCPREIQCLIRPRVIVDIVDSFLIMTIVSIHM